jgi:shikimate kinase
MIIIDPLGFGKSTIGRLLAARLRMSAVDMHLLMKPKEDVELSAHFLSGYADD